MLTADIGSLSMNDIASSDDPSISARFSFPFYAATGTQNTGVVYFEVPAGQRLGMHHDSAEEVILILEGAAEATVAGERGRLEAGQMALIPAWAPHDVANISSETLKVVGFFASATLIHAFHEPIIPGAEIAVIVHDDKGESVFTGASMQVPVAV